MHDVLDALASTDVLVVQTALDDLASQALAASGRGHNALPSLLGLSTTPPTTDDEDDLADDEDGEDFPADEDGDGELDDDGDGDGDHPPSERSGALPPIDHALDLHLAQLASTTLVHLFRALFHECTDSFPAAARIAAEVARRGDDATQLALVDAFITANEHHDTGHRQEDAVHDVLIDEVFPALRAPALTWLLTWCSNAHLDDASGDRMFGLFAPALATAEAADRASLLTRLEVFMRELVDEHPERAALLWANLEGLTGPARDAVAELRAHLAPR